MRNQLKIYLLLLFVALIGAGIVRSCTSIADGMQRLYNERQLLTEIQVYDLKRRSICTYVEGELQEFIDCDTRSKIHKNMFRTDL